jgi:hypothetical protein
MGVRVIVTDDRDRRQWLELLGRVPLRFGWRSVASMLMDNHFHLFLSTLSRTIGKQADVSSSSPETC